MPFLGRELSVLFIAIFVTFFLAIFAGIYWLAGRWLMLVGVPYNTKRSRIARSVLGVAFVVLCGIWRAVVIVVMHIIAFALLCELLALVGRRIGRRHRGKKIWSVCRVIYRSAAVPLLLTAVIMIYGIANMWNIVRTDYTVTSSKLKEEHRIVLMTDTHFGSIQAPEVLEAKIDEVNALNADMIILCGDIVDESTTREQLEQVFDIYSRMKSKLGTFYTYGNHDRQEYAVADRRAYTEEELAQVIRSHGITILQDDYIELGDDLVLVGREDKSYEEKPRLSSAELLKDVDRSKFIIVSDHQPVEAEVNAEQGADLQLSGHTHAGQIYPFGLFIELVGKLNYGEYHKGDLTAIVSSGTTGWGFPIRTEEHCEYVLVTLQPAK